MDEKISDLQQLRIHELRDLARKMGVSAPTSKKKEEIIAEIIKIMNGESVPFSSITKKGRPARPNAENFDVVDFILPNQNEMQSFNKETKYDMSQERLSFMVRMNETEFGPTDPNKVFVRDGIIEVKSEGFGVLHVQGFTSNVKDVFVNQILVRQLKLKSGELLNVKSRRVKDNYPEIAFEITRLEDESVENFDDLPAKPLSKKISLKCPDIKEFCLGGRYYVAPSYDSYYEVEDIANEIFDNISECKVEALYINAMREKLPYECHAKVNSIEFYKPDEDIINATNLYFERLKRIAERGNDIICVVNEITQYVKSNNNIYIKSGQMGEISNKTSFLTKSLLSTAKYTDKGSITIIAVDPLKLPTGIYDLFKFDILPIFNETIK